MNLAVSVVHVGKHRGHHRCANSKRNLVDSSKSLALVYITKHAALLMGRQCFKNKLETGSKKNESVYRWSKSLHVTNRTTFKESKPLKVSAIFTVSSNGESLGCQERLMNKSYNLLLKTKSKRCFKLMWTHIYSRLQAQTLLDVPCKPTEIPVTFSWLHR